HYRTSDHDFFRWVLFRSARVSRPRRMADRKLGSFASVISQLFVLSHNPQTTNTRSVWLRSGAFLSPPVPLPSASLTTGHYPLAPRLTLHAPRPLGRRPPGPAGSGRAQTLPRWLLPATDRPGSREVLLPPRPLRTGRESCPSSSSSIH